MTPNSNNTNNAVDINWHFKYNLSAKSSDYCMILFYFTMMINMHESYILLL